MQTYPCGHKVVCRKCFVKTIQVAVTQRCLPLRCVVCRTRILKLKQTAPGRSSSSGAPSTKESHHPSASSRSHSAGRGSQSIRQSLSSGQSSRSNGTHSSRPQVTRQAQQVAKDMWAHGFSVAKDSRHGTHASHTSHSTHAPHTPKASHSTTHANSPRTSRGGGGLHSNKTPQHAAIATKARRTPIKQ